MAAISLRKAEWDEVVRILETPSDDVEATAKELLKTVYDMFRSREWWVAITATPGMPAVNYGIEPTSTAALAAATGPASGSYRIARITPIQGYLDQAAALETAWEHRRNSECINPKCGHHEANHLGRCDVKGCRCQGFQK